MSVFSNIQIGEEIIWQNSNQQYTLGIIQNHSSDKRIVKFITNDTRWHGIENHIENGLNLFQILESHLLQGRACFLLFSLSFSFSIFF